MRATRWVLVASAALAVVAQTAQTSVEARPQATTVIPAGAASHQAVITRYCLSCHSERLRTGGLVLEELDVANVGTHPETWERVVRKLRMQAMPPPGAPRPDSATYKELVSYLERALDSAAEGKLEPGRTEALHRLNSTEYRNAIRDLLALEIDTTGLLPADAGADQGFDTMASVLTLSPALMERYLSAARTISRLAVGVSSIGRTIVPYDVPLEALQNDRMNEDLPFGSRGGVAVRHHFPVDGEYWIRVRLTKNYVDYVRGLLYPHQVEIRLDKAKVKEFTIGGEWEPKDFAPASFGGNINGNVDWEHYAHHADEVLNVRLLVKAGSHLVAATFPREQWEGEGILQRTQAGFSLAVNDMPDENPAVAQLIIEGPLTFTGSGDTASRKRIFTCQPTKRTEAACARKILSTLARRAFRRPVAAADVEPFMALYASKRGDGADFETGIQFALEGVLSHPRFLVRVERDPHGIEPNTPYRPSDLELASRLSFFLWSSIPDDELLAVAERGELKNPVILERQVRRMINDPKSSALVENFVGQWLLVRNVAGWLPNVDLYPTFDDNLRQAFRRETELFINSQLRSDGSVLELLSAKYTFLNERLARHYGVTGIYGSHFRRVQLPDTQSRGGILGHGSVLMVTSYPDRTSPVLRGKWILSNFLGSPPSPPPANVPPLPAKGEGGKPATVRERLEVHRKNVVCATCHALMDPLGFALENFDPVGRWRTISDGKPVDSVGVLPGGLKFTGMAGLREALLTTYRDQFVSTMAQKMLEYALGRELKYYDGPALRRITRTAKSYDYTWSALILEIVRSTPFQMRRSAS